MWWLPLLCPLFPGTRFPKLGSPVEGPESPRFLEKRDLISAQGTSRLSPRRWGLTWYGHSRHPSPLSQWACSGGTSSSQGASGQACLVSKCPTHDTYPGPSQASILRMNSTPLPSPVPPPPTPHRCLHSGVYMGAPFYENFSWGVLVGEGPADDRQGWVEGEAAGGFHPSPGGSGQRTMTQETPRDLGTENVGVGS